MIKITPTKTITTIEQWHKKVSSHGHENLLIQTCENSLKQTYFLLALFSLAYWLRSNVAHRAIGVSSLAKVIAESAFDISCRCWDEVGTDDVSCDDGGNGDGSADIGNGDGEDGSGNDDGNGGISCDDSDDDDGGDNSDGDISNDDGNGDISCDDSDNDDGRDNSDGDFVKDDGNDDISWW